ncbi:hypothetical protein [Sunxiuqinia elliptica]|uniref:hypothetical protein n=1 Tax=Sunxiuqinia elliptica TaxID=655355 RepID=UPI0011133779|nr:hypothetical protein [Sunxiuqinia elliptica]
MKYYFIVGDKITRYCKFAIGVLSIKANFCFCKAGHGSKTSASKSFIKGETPANPKNIEEACCRIGKALKSN